MRSALMIAAASGIALMAISSARAQGSRTEMNACFTSVMRTRIESQRPMQLSAETITLTGDTLRLTGRAWVRFNDTSIQAEEVVLNQATKRIDLAGNVNASFGSASPCARPPRVEFR